MKTIFLLSIIILANVSFAQKNKLKGNQRAFYECTEPMDIDSVNVKVKTNKLYFHFNVEDPPENLKSLSFVWLKDNPKGYFTGYLINTSDSTFSAERQDNSLIMIQEALDKKGVWRPIEYWVYSGCGNSYYNPLKLDSGKYVMIPIRKYTGDYKTKIRLKFKYDDDILYSNSFDGAIDMTLFEKETNDVYGILYHGPANYLNKE